MKLRGSEVKHQIVFLPNYLNKLDRNKIETSQHGSALGLVPAAKFLSLAPYLSPAQVKALIMNTVDKRDDLKDQVLTSGVVNARRALQAAYILAYKAAKKSMEEMAHSLDIDQMETSLLLQTAQEINSIH